MSSSFATPSSDSGRWAVDTSVAIAYLDAGHSAHEACVAALVGRSTALAGHAAFESYSVLTRLPDPVRVLTADAQRALAAAFPERCWLSPQAQDELLARLAGIGIASGAVYDALVGEAARLDGRVLLTRGHRARPTYELLGVTYQLVGSAR
ncbi:MAG: type II toxin-antitoxin system VapC family toxin [Propionicimonas sp.]|nr:type II toxin-antitoxin system VapC family toxin [Propionicimonas sp.]